MKIITTYKFVNLLEFNATSEVCMLLLKLRLVVAIRETRILVVAIRRQTYKAIVLFPSWFQSFLDFPYSSTDHSEDHITGVEFPTAL